MKKNLTGFLFGIISIACMLFVCCDSEKEEQPRIELKEVEKGEGHPITLQDILCIRELHEPKISPNGKKVAFIIKQAFLDINDYRSALFSIDTDTGRKPVKILEEKSLSQISWSPNGAFITYLSTKNGSNQVWKVEAKGGNPSQLFHHSGGVSRYEWSPDGSKIAFISVDSIGPDEKERVAEEGVVYSDRFWFRDIIEKSYIKKPLQLWIYDLQKKTEEKIWEHTSSIYKIFWSPDASNIAMSYLRSDKSEEGFKWDIGVISLKQERMIPIITWESFNDLLCWSLDGKSIVFNSAGDISGRDEVRPSSIFMFHSEEKKIVKLTDVRSRKAWWDIKKNRLLLEIDDRSQSALYELPSIGGVIKKISKGEDHLSDFSYTADKTKAVCIWQSPMKPPELAVVNLRDGSTNVLTNLNPHFQNIILGEVSELKWNNKYGDKTNGFLIKPIGYVEGEHYPFLLIMYGFSNKFISQAQWISNYPAQVFAAEGYAVLLMNFPERMGYERGNFEDAAMSVAYNPLASIEKAVELVIEMGIADPNKKAMMGLSRGSFITDFTITHSDLFEVASSADGGLLNPSRYWMENGQYRYWNDGVFGGPPYVDWYNNWREISPALNAHKVRIPVLMEYQKRLWGIEFYTALKKQGADVELIFYPDDAHVLFQPKHRLASMQRNIDWFNFWLKEKIDPNQSKKSQYKRWNLMKERLRNLN